MHRNGLAGGVRYERDHGRQLAALRMLTVGEEAEGGGGGQAGQAAACEVAVGRRARRRDAARPHAKRGGLLGARVQPRLALSGGGAGGVQSAPATRSSTSASWGKVQPLAQ